MILVVGAGAAGLVAAIFAARAGAQVRLLERTTEIGKKILISGGGRCNVLPAEPSPERFVTDSPPHLLRGMLRSWSLLQQRAFFEDDLHLPLTLEAESGKLFPASNRARDVRDALVAHARALGVDIELGAHVIALEPRGAEWGVHTTSGEVVASRVLLATGGLSVPTTGSDGSGLRMAAALGHSLHKPYPALTPLTAAPAPHADLSGLSLSVRLRARDGRRLVETRGGFLFTHRGYSGPAVLDISHLPARRPDVNVRVQWTALDESEWAAMLSAPNGLVSSVLNTQLPQRLSVALMKEAGVPLERRAADLRRRERLDLLERLTSYSLPFTGDEGFKKAEVTGGGVALDQVSPHTLESRRHPGLFLCGEMLDAFGPIGGHNFAWAWATGRLAGVGAAATRN